MGEDSNRGTTDGDQGERRPPLENLAEISLLANPEKRQMSERAGLTPENACYTR